MMWTLAVYEPNTGMMELYDAIDYEREWQAWDAWKHYTALGFDAEVILM